jgi:hypothetical protein
MPDSILTSTKKVLGIADDYTAFDVDVIMHINSVFSTLAGLGVGPEQGFMIEDDTAIWEEFLGTDLHLNQVKSYMYLRVRLMFDPPTTGHHVTALKEQVKEMEWRLNVRREELVEPYVPEPVDEENVFGDPVVLDGGVGF